MQGHTLRSAALIRESTRIPSALPYAVPMLTVLPTMRRARMTLFRRSLASTCTSTGPQLQLDRRRARRWQHTVRFCSTFTCTLGSTLVALPNFKNAAGASHRAGRVSSNDERPALVTHREWSCDHVLVSLDMLQLCRLSVAMCSSVMLAITRISNGSMQVFDITIPPSNNRSRLVPGRGTQTKSGYDSPENPHGVA